MTSATLEAEHFNSLHALIPNLYGNAARFLVYCQEALGVLSAHGDFADEFTAIVRTQPPSCIQLNKPESPCFV